MLLSVCRGSTGVFVIDEIFIDREAKKIGKPDRYGAVCICLLGEKDNPSVLFEVRAGHLSQPGDICFPGGKEEDGEVPVETAIRECMEELCIERNQIHLLGPSDYYVTSAEFTCFPFVVWLTDYKGSFHRDELK